MMDQDADGQNHRNHPPKPRTLCRYLSKWETTFHYLTSSHVGPNYAFCKVCRCNFSVGHGGKNDVSQHNKSLKHKRANESARHTTSLLSSFVVNRASSEADKILKAEVKMSMLIAKNNVAFSFLDDFNHSVADMFPDSAIAKKYTLGKTKATQIIKGAIALDMDEEVTSICKSQPFSLLCDESNNRNTDKQFVILARVYNEANLEVATKFLDMPTCNVGNAENLFNKLDITLRNRGIPWKNLIAFNSDNASVMKGRHNSVISRVKTNQPNVQDLGCICHLVQLATGCGMKATKLPVEDILVGIYTHFDKRCELYKDFVEFTDSDSLKLLRYCSTRWLSLLSCIERVLNQWAALQAYFNSHEGVETNTKIRDLSKHLNDPLIKAYFKFLSVALKPLSDFNIAFQSEQVQIHKLDKEMTRLIKRMLGCCKNRFCC